MPLFRTTGISPINAPADLLNKSNVHYSWVIISPRAGSEIMLCLSVTQFCEVRSTCRIARKLHCCNVPLLDGKLAEVKLEFGEIRSYDTHYRSMLFDLDCASCPTAPDSFLEACDTYSHVSMLCTSIFNHCSLAEWWDSSPQLAALTMELLSCSGSSRAVQQCTWPDGLSR